MKKIFIFCFVLLLLALNYWAITQRDKEIKACKGDKQCIHKVLVAYS